MNKDAEGMEQGVRKRPDGQITYPLRIVTLGQGVLR